MRDYATAQLTRRPATDADLDLIYSILRAALGPYVEQTWGAWDETAQRQRFDEVTHAADHAIIEIDGLPIGCLCLKTSDVEVRLIRLFILPEFQKHRFGTHILREVLALADEQRLPIRLRVLRVNPARHFYERHGFAVTEESETHYTMVRPVTASNAPMAIKPELRRSARLIILDQDGRLLLFRYQDEHKPAFWATAGGELQAGEEYRDAAQRELQEETGFKLGVGPLLHEREDIYAVARSGPAQWIEHYFLVECDRAGTPSRANWTDEERTTIQDWKWWSLDEMRDQADSFLPKCLPEILENTLRWTRKRPGRNC